MSKPITTMERYEIKFILSKEQTAFMIEELKKHMNIDQYGLTSIASIYYDTPDFRLIRNSIERPYYKEKIRLRSYGASEEGDQVFLELKRKSGKVVYKRRISTTLNDANEFFSYIKSIEDNQQITKEIVYFRDYYKNLSPQIMVISDRTAYVEPTNDVRLTIDFHPRYRTNNFDFSNLNDGSPLLPEGSTILEIKVRNNLPLWLTHILSEGKIYKTNFSKVGTAYLLNIGQERI